MPETPTTLPPFSKPKSHEWNITLTKTQISKLQEGFEPRDMDDRWCVYSTILPPQKAKNPPTQKGGAGKKGKIMKVSFVRSWTSNRTFEVDILLADGEGEGEEVGGEIFEITWESDQSIATGMDFARAKVEVRGLCEGLVGVVIAGEEEGDGAGEQEVEEEEKEKWWKFWKRWSRG